MIGQVNDLFDWNISHNQNDKQYFVQNFIFSFA